MVFFTRIVLCSECFQDSGLKADAARLGFNALHRCPNCKSRNGKRLNHHALFQLARQFFVDGTFISPGYGGAPIVQFNEHRAGSEVAFGSPLDEDVALISSALGIGFFYYGPNLWMLGDTEPLNQLAVPETRQEVIQRIIDQYPVVTLMEAESFHRLRKNPRKPSHHEEYDSPPTEFIGEGRLDSKNLPIFYASRDIEVCIHECRVTVDDDVYLATFKPNQTLRLLDLSAIITEESVSDFEALDVSIYMLFLAGSISYDICRAIAVRAKEVGFDGVIYPSFFSMLRTGSRPFETSYGISLRRMSALHEYERAKIVGNLGLFGYPLAEKKIELISLNRLRLRKASYVYSFGPILTEFDEPELPTANLGDTATSST